MVALFRVLLRQDGVALPVAPPLAGGALDNQLPLLVALLTERTEPQGGALPTRGVVLKPGAVGPGRVGPTVLT